MPSIAHLARILSLLMVLRGALAGPIVVPEMPCAVDAAKKAASDLGTNKLFAKLANTNNANNAGSKATDTSIADLPGFPAGDNKVDAKGKANQGNTNADGAAAVQKSSLSDPKNAGAAASGQLNGDRTNGGNPIVDKFSPSIATPIGNKKQGVADAQKNANGVDDNKFLSSVTADDRTPGDSNNAALSQTGKASKDNKEANESVALNNGKSSSSATPLLTGVSANDRPAIPKVATSRPPTGNGSPSSPSGDKLTSTTSASADKNRVMPVDPNATLGAAGTNGQGNPSNVGTAAIDANGKKEQGMVATHASSGTNSQSGGLGTTGKTLDVNGNQHGGASRVQVNKSTDREGAKTDVIGQNKQSMNGAGNGNNIANVGPVGPVQFNTFGENNANEKAGAAKNGGKKGDDC